MKIVSRPPSEAKPSRIATLSILPVFFDLTGKRVVVAGGSEATVWKAELLAAAGAEVHLYAPENEMSAEARQLADDRSNVVMHLHVWDASSLSGAAIAVATVQDDAEAAAFEAAARAAGAPCNIVDRPAFCHFQFGSIVNRSPVVVGISTSGAAPILGQAVRRRIETLLPPALAQWGALAKRLRARVAERVPTGAGRRAFWNHLVDRAFGTAPDDSAEAELTHAMDGTAPAAAHGHVTFVGAGPGDAELLTLKAVRALQSADVILFDDLVSDDVLELARREAKRILVGKRAGRPSCKQDEINATMIALAKAGRRVVRLKSGDPMIFGRAGEEITELEEAGIGYDVVPGITAGVALAATLGTSLTHRDHAKSVRFVTGHSKAGGLPQDIDWRAVADPSATTLFYMSGRTAGQISENLLALGMAPDTPAVVAADIGRPSAMNCLTVLAGLPAAIAATDTGKPVMIGIGSVFAPSSTRRFARGWQRTGSMTSTAVR